MQRVPAHWFDGVYVLGAGATARFGRVRSWQVKSDISCRLCFVAATCGVYMLPAKDLSLSEHPSESSLEINNCRSGRAPHIWRVICVSIVIFVRIDVISTNPQRPIDWATARPGPVTNGHRKEHISPTNFDIHHEADIPAPCFHGLMLYCGLFAVLYTYFLLTWIQINIDHPFDLRVLLWYF
jgi:hypothetical protein